MRVKFLLAALLTLSLFSCSKNDDAGSGNEQKLTANSWQQTNTAAATDEQKPVATFSANHDFTLSLNSAISGAGSYTNIGATITGKWSYEGNNIVISNTSVSYKANGTSAANFQAVVSAYAGGLVAFNTFVQAYCNLLQVDASGNLTVKGASSGSFTWAVSQISSSVLVVVSGGATASFSAK